METIARTIPNHTPPQPLGDSSRAYLNPNTPMPTHYRLLVLARIATLLVATSRKPEGAR